LCAFIDAAMKSAREQATTSSWTSEFAPPGPPLAAASAPPSGNAHNDADAARECSVHQCAADDCRIDAASCMTDS